MNIQSRNQLLYLTGIVNIKQELDCGDLSPVEYRDIMNRLHYMYAQLDPILLMHALVDEQLKFDPYFGPKIAAAKVA